MRCHDRFSNSIVADTRGSTAGVFAATLPGRVARWKATAMTGRKVRQHLLRVA